MNASVWEIGLFVMLVVMAVLLFVPLHRFDKKVRITSLVVSVIVIKGHVFLEGYNFFMVPLYILYILFLVLNIVRLKRVKSPSKTWKRKVITIVLACLCTVLVSIALIIPGYIAPPVKIAKPTGAYTVGAVNYHWIDSSREEVNTPEQDHRQLRARIWYPADSGQDAKKAPYAWEIDKVLSEKHPFMDKVIMNVINRVEGNTYDAVPVAKDQQQYPVLLLSHGYGFSLFSNTTFAEELASHGFIVVSVEHPYYNSVPSVLSDGSLASGMVELGMADNWDIMKSALNDVLIKDIQFVLDQINTIQSNDPHGLLNGRLDLSRLGMLGQSTGGALAAQMMQVDERITAGVNMDGFPYGEPIDDLKRPFMYMITGDTEYFMSSTMPEHMWSDPDDYAIASKERYDIISKQVSDGVRTLVRNGGYKVVFPEASHMSFTDFELYTPLLDMSEGDNQKLHQSINGLLVAFFTEKLKQEEAPLLHKDKWETDLYRIEGAPAE